MISSGMAGSKRNVSKKPVTRSKTGRILKKPVEMYHQNCVMMATTKENGRRKERARVKNMEKQKRFQEKQKLEILQEQKKSELKGKKPKAKKKAKKNE